MALILQIETATTSCSVSLAKDGNCLFTREANERNIHAEVITRFITEVFEYLNVDLNSIDAVAVSSGPGSYTGLRIGVSTAKGLCFALNKPLIAVDTLAAMAGGLLLTGNFKELKDRLYCPMIDARRMEVYTALFNNNGINLKPVSAEIIDENSFEQYLKDYKIVFFGDGAEKCKSVLSNKTNVFFVDDFINSASFLTGIAAEKFEKSDFVNLALFEPFYLKEFIAGIKKAV